MLEVKRLYCRLEGRNGGFLAVNFLISEWNAVMKLGFRPIQRIASAALGVALVACAGQTPATSVPAPSTPEVMPAKINSNIVDFSLEDLTVPVGTTITWVNRDSVPHTTTQGTGPNKADSAEWDSEVLMQNQSFSFTVDKPGTFAYFCTIHPNMRATITVEKAAS